MVIWRLTALLWLLFLAVMRRNAPTDAGKNLTRPAPKVGGSRAAADTRLPW